MSLQHGSSDLPATYARGTKRLDYILMSERCANAVQTCGYEPFNHRLFSDHRGMFLDMNMQLLFGNQDNVLASMQYRDFHATDPKTITDYLQRVFTYLREHNFSERLQRLIATAGTDHVLAEALDKDLTRACLSASAHCR
jgi:hypothetical protein